MKKIVYSAVAFVLLTGTAFAGTEKIFKKMDVDNNGKVTLKEHADLWDGWFKQTDKNGDGALEWKEWGVTAFDSIDKNKDKKIDAAEHEAFRNNLFKFYDANKDGHVTLEEYTTKKK